MVGSADLGLPDAGLPLAGGARQARLVPGPRRWLTTPRSPTPSPPGSWAPRRPAGQPAIRMATADLPNAITALPCFLVFEPDDDWPEQGNQRRHGTLTYKCRLVLPQSDEPRTQRLALNWRTALYTRLDGYIHLGGAQGVAQAIVTETATGKLTYAETEYPSVEVTVVVTVSESMTTTP